MNSITTQLFHLSTNDPWLTGFIEAAIVLIVASWFLIFSKKLLKPLVLRVASATNLQLDERILKAFISLFRKIVLVIAAALAVTSLPLPHDIEIIIHDTTFVIVACFILVGLFDIANICGMFVRKKAPEFEILVNRILKIVFATLVLMVTLQHFNYSVLHILTALGVGSLAVGLAAQPTLTNMIAGFTILLDRPFRKGDRISLSATEIGEVTNIGMRSTYILNADGNILVVSNSDLVNSRLVNFDFPNQTLAQKVKFYLTHGTNLQDVKNTLKGIADVTPGIVRGSPKALISSVTEWGTEVTVSYNLEHYGDGGKTTDSLIDVAILEFQKKGVVLATSPFLPPRN